MADKDGKPHGSFKQTVKKNMGKVKINADELNFLRQAEKANDVDVGVDDFGLGMEDYKPKKPTSSVRRGTISSKGFSSGHKGASKNTSSSLVLADVADDLNEIGTNSSSAQSDTSKSRAKTKDPKLLKKLITADHKIHPLNDDDKNKSSDAKRVSIEDAKKIRRKLTKRRRRVEHCTYQMLVVIISIRLITTLMIIYEYEELNIILEYLKRLRKVNCVEVYDWMLIDLWPIILLLYFTACCILPTLTRRDLAKACIIWMLIQILYTGHRFFLAQQFFFFREVFVTKLSLIVFGVHFALDVISYTVVMIRYYYWANPSLEREQYSNTMLGDYLVNEYIQFMVQSSFIRKKTAVQRATAFQIMTVVRKLREKYRSSGDGPSEQAIQKEVKSAIHALEDWKKFPALRIIHSFEVKEKIMKEKLKLRRMRIREMRRRFNELLANLRRQDALAKKQPANRGKVFMNKQGRAIAVKGNEKQVMMDVIQAMKSSKNPDSYVNKRNALMNQTKPK